MHLTPLPDHNRTGDRQWRQLWNGYAHVITPLRGLGLPVDVETAGGDDYTIVTDLPDGSYLRIGSEFDDLPVDPADVIGWKVTRAHQDRPLEVVAIYDSILGGTDDKHGAAVAPMLSRIIHRLLTSPGRDPGEDTATRAADWLAYILSSLASPSGPTNYMKAVRR